MTKIMKLGFCGSGAFAATCLFLLSERIKPEWVITNAPKPSGRGMKLKQTPVYEAAQALSVPCFTTDKISSDEERLEWVRKNLPDLILVIDFGHMIKEPLLNMPPLGCINVHPSMLPAYRGSAPVQRALMDGLAETGVTVFRLDKGMDSGPVLAQAAVQIDPEDDAASLLEKSAKTGMDILLRFICEVDPDKWTFTPQSSENISLAPKIDKAEGRIDWDAAAQDIFNKVRALNVSPGAYCIFKDKRLRILKAAAVQKDGSPGVFIGTDGGMPVIACGRGALKLISIQPEGKKVQSADEWLCGSRLKIGDIFS